MLKAVISHNEQAKEITAEKDEYSGTVKGNSGDSCRQNQYPVGHYEILGYGVPSY